MRKGFFTIATGDKKYYRLANNLLQSYRLHNSQYPFSILCDRENEYTKDFDEVILLNDVKMNYQDKFRMLIDSPYDEGFFIEPDCLIYRNISHFFDLFAESSDVASFGWNDAELTTWFDNPEKIIEKYGKCIQSTPLFCPGYMFIRKSDTCKKMYHDLIVLADWILENTISDNPRLMGGSGLRDDPLFFIAMKLNKCSCPVKPRIGKCINYPRVKKLLGISMQSGTLDVLQEEEYNNCNLLHFSTRRCIEEGLYLHQCICLKMCMNHYPKIIISIFEKSFFIAFFEFFKRIKYSIIHRLA